MLYFDSSSFSINSSSYGPLTPDDVYNLIDSYINLRENSVSDLAASGITVTIKEPTCGHYKLCDWIAVMFHKSIYQSMKEEMIADLVAMSDKIERGYQEHLYEEAVECIQTAVQNSDMAQREVGEPSRYPGLWELAEARTLTIEELYEIIKAHGWN